jgi:hypothetical protein
MGRSGEKFHVDIFVGWCVVKQNKVTSLLLELRKTPKAAVSMHLTKCNSGFELRRNFKELYAGTSYVV